MAGPPERRATTETLTDSVFREVSGRAVTHTRGFVLRAAPVVESLAELADKGLAVDDPDRLAPQLLGALKANPGLSWVSYGDESGRSPARPARRTAGSASTAAGS